MSDTRETLRRGIGDFAPQPDAYPRVLERRRRRERNRRIGAITVAAVIALGGTVVIIQELRSAAVPVDQPTPIGAVSDGAVVYSAVELETIDREIPVRSDPRDLFLTTSEGETSTIAGSLADGIDQSCPAFSPDGTTLAYVERAGEGQGVSVMVLGIAQDGAPVGDPREIAAIDRAISGCPLWSPDGDRLAIDDGRQLMIVSPDGATRSLPYGSISDSSYVEAFAWSPDGDTLVVLDRGVVRLVTADSGERVEVWTHEEDQLAEDIAWGPDGEHLAIAGRFGSPNHCCDGSTPFLEIVDIGDGSRATLSTRGDAAGDSIWQVLWPEGPDRLLVRYGHGDVDLMDPTGVAPTVPFDLAYDPASTFIVSPDQQWVLYVAYDGSSYAVAAERIGSDDAPVLYSPWTFGLYTNVGDLAWQPIPA